jgi:hypothetical protein
MRPTEADPLRPGLLILEVGSDPGHHLTVTETLRRGPVSLPVSRLPTAARGRSRRAAARAAARPGVQCLGDRSAPRTGPGIIELLA